MKPQLTFAHVTFALALTVSLASSRAVAHEDHEHKPAKPAKAATPAAPAAPAVHGPGDHHHDAPHGGLVATVDKDTHVEVLFTDADVQAWWYDANLKPIALPTDAKATVVVGKDVKKIDLPIAKNADGTATDHLGAALATAKDQKVSIVIQATVAGKPRSARLERAAATAPAPAPAPAPK